MKCHGFVFWSAAVTIFFGIVLSVSSEEIGSREENVQSQSHVEDVLVNQDSQTRIKRYVQYR